MIFLRALTAVGAYFFLFKLNLFSLSVEVVSYCRLISVNVINKFRLNRCYIYGVVEERFREHIESVCRWNRLLDLPMRLYGFPIWEGKRRVLPALGRCECPVLEDHARYGVAKNRLVLKLDGRLRP